MRRLRFLCFNIHGGRSLDGIQDIRRVHALMERLDIDIGVFQEMETRVTHGGKASDVMALAGESRPHHVCGASIVSDHGWYGNLIVSRYPILRSFVHNLETSPQLEPRNAVDALIATPYGKVRVIGTHLSLSLIERWSEANSLLRLMRAVEEKEKNPLFLMGDINEWQWPSKLIRFLNSVMTAVPCKGTFPSFFPVLKLDRIWHEAPGLPVYAHRLAGPGIRQLSDHLPLLMEVDYGAGGS